MKSSFLFPMMLVLALLRTVCAQDAAMEMIDKIPSNSGDDYNCRDMIRVVNHLRGLGKERALETLRSYIDAHPAAGNQNVLLISRVLFVNTNNWNVLMPGLSRPEVSTNAYVLFPAFPIAISDHIPFVLVNGYLIAGNFGRPAADCLKDCRKLALINADITNTKYEAAARKLVNSKAFEVLYNDGEIMRNMSEMIYRQAGVKLP